MELTTLGEKLGLFKFNINRLCFVFVHVFLQSHSLLRAVSVCRPGLHLWVVFAAIACALHS